MAPKLFLSADRALLDATRFGALNGGITVILRAAGRLPAPHSAEGLQGTEARR
ncbi:hypothetical protein GCM10010280_16520 [Streptomyces pilosus]|uniref:Uncharacterized protein n=1 Tax=Streptomyces pilosus TaxID=28893 RepID=A0A918EVB7_9ACTN|nr:hypothetical protein GCM10010280_16520 [Streptomyces pilosus]